MNCLICGGTEAEMASVVGKQGVCVKCFEFDFAMKVKLLQLRRIADALENIEKKVKDKNGW